MAIRWTIVSQVVVFCSAFPATAGVQSWVTFVDQTDTRIDTSQDPNSGPSVVQMNWDEKDYAWGDVDNDGDTDLVAVYALPGIYISTTERRNVLLINDNGVLVDRTTQFATASSVMLAGGETSQGFLDLTGDRDVALVDVSGDGWLDIVTAVAKGGDEGGTIGDKAVSHPRVFVNLGDDPPGTGVWQGFIFDDVDRVPTMPAEPRFHSVSFGDIDDDGDNDLYFTDFQQGGARPIDVNDRLWINDGTGYFTDETLLRMTPQMVNSSFGYSSAMADMNADGALDVIKVSYLTAPYTLSIIYNDPANEGIFFAFENIFPLPQLPMVASVGNLNNDAYPDVAVTDHNLDRYLLGVGNGADGLADFAPPALLVGSLDDHGGNNHIADLDQDGFNDVLVANFDTEDGTCNQPSKIFRNFGLEPDGFSLTIAEDGNAGIAQFDLNGVHDFAVFDLNGDTWLDLVIGNCNGTKVYMNVPQECLLSGDMNGDGLRDGRDIPIFVDCFFGPGVSCACADTDANLVLDTIDVKNFVAQLLLGA